MDYDNFSTDDVCLYLVAKGMVKLYIDDKKMSNKKICHLNQFDVFG